MQGDVHDFAWMADKRAGKLLEHTYTGEGSHSDLKPHTADAYGLDFVTIHKCGHGYFYGILCSSEFEEPMLYEGFNEYWSARMLRDSGQVLQTIPLALRHLGMNLKASHFELLRLSAGNLMPWCWQIRQPN